MGSAGRTLGLAGSDGVPGADGSLLWPEYRHSWGREVLDFFLKANGTQGLTHAKASRHSTTEPHPQLPFYFFTSCIPGKCLNLAS